MNRSIHEEGRGVLHCTVTLKVIQTKAASWPGNMVNMRIVLYFLWLFCQASWPGNMVNV